MKPRDREALLDVRKAARLSLSFVAGMGFDEFEADIKTQSAVLYQIAVVGEAVKRLSMSFRDDYTTVPWSAMAGMRDKLIHDYGGVDIQRVWQTLRESIPPLLELIEPLLYER